MPNTTIYDVAKKVGVSTATVSRVIHTPQRVSESVYKRVHEAFEELNYSYNATAANMSKGKTSSIGVLAPSMRDSIFANTLVGIQEQALIHKHHVIVADTQFNPNTERLLLEKFVEQRVGGILLIGYCPENEEFLKSLKKSGIRIIILWEIMNNSLNFVGFDNYNASQEIAEYIISLKHQKIALIVGQYTKTMRSKSRFDACIDTLEKHKIQYDKDLIFEGLPTTQYGYETMKAILAKDRSITAVWCNNDLQAIGAMKCIKDHGLRVPEDISVCGFDDVDIAEYYDPPLTTIKVPAFEIGVLAASMLFENILYNKPIISKMLDTKFILRGSCAAHK